MNELRETGYTVVLLQAVSPTDLTQRIQQYLDGRSWIYERCVSVSHSTNAPFSYIALVTIAKLERKYDE